MSYDNIGLSITHNTEHDLVQCYASILGPMNATLAGLIVDIFQKKSRTDLLAKWIGTGDRQTLVRRLVTNYSGADNFCFEHETLPEKNAYKAVLDGLVFIEPFQAGDMVARERIKEMMIQEQNTMIIHEQVYGVGPCGESRYQQPAQQPLTLR